MSKNEDSCSNTFFFGKHKLNKLPPHTIFLYLLLSKCLCVCVFSLTHTLFSHIHTSVKLILKWNHFWNAFMNSKKAFPHYILRDSYGFQGRALSYKVFYFPVQTTFWNIYLSFLTWIVRLLRMYALTLNHFNFISSHVNLSSIVIHLSIYL